MNEGVRVFLQLECESNELKKSIGEYIHNQLKGNRDYRDSNIVLNIDEPYTVRLWVFEECKDVPKITLPDMHWRWKVPECYTDGTEKIVSGKREGEEHD